MSEKNLDQSLNFKLNDEETSSSDESSKKIGNYILGHTIGEGTFGKVKIATHEITNEKVAMKILDKQKLIENDDLSHIQSEIQTLKRIKHNNIIQVYEIIDVYDHLHIVMELAEGGDLFEYISSHSKLEEIVACKFFQQLISSLEYLHSISIVHRDIKPENLLIDFKKDLKLSDFGLAKPYDNSQLLHSSCGTPSYASPELLYGEGYHGLYSDVWSTGIVLFAMVAGYLPFEDDNEDVLRTKIIEGNFEIPEHFSNSLTDLIRNILRRNPRDRFDFDDIKNHPWFNIITYKFYPGLNLKTHHYPIDEKILEKLEKVFDDDHELMKFFLNNNEFNEHTTAYYLILKKHIREGGRSISDLRSIDFINFLENSKTRKSDSNLELCENQENYQKISRNAVRLLFNNYSRNDEKSINDIGIYDLRKSFRRKSLFPGKLTEDDELNKSIRKAKSLDNTLFYSFVKLEAKIEKMIKYSYIKEKKIKLSNIPKLDLNEIKVQKQRFVRTTKQKNKPKFGISSANNRSKSRLSKIEDSFKGEQYQQRFSSMFRSSMIKLLNKDFQNSVISKKLSIIENAPNTSRNLMHSNSIYISLNKTKLGHDNVKKSGISHYYKNSSICLTSRDFTLRESFKITKKSENVGSPKKFVHSRNNQSEFFTPTLKISKNPDLAMNNHTKDFNTCKSARKLEKKTINVPQIRHSKLNLPKESNQSLDIEAIVYGDKASVLKKVSNSLEKLKILYLSFGNKFNLKCEKDGKKFNINIKELFSSQISYLEINKGFENVHSTNSIISSLFHEVKKYNE